MKKILFIALLLIVFVVGTFLVTTQNKQPLSKEEALEQARNFEHGLCTSVITPAVHNDSGARYNFPSGCLPDGWSRVQ